MPGPMPPGAAPQGQPPQQGGGGEQKAVQAIQMIQQGFKELGAMIQSAGNSLDPQDIKMFQQAVQATDNLIQSLTGPAQGGQQAPPKQPGGPMPPNANAGATPAPQG